MILHAEPQVLNEQISIVISTVSNNFKLPRFNIEQYGGNFKNWMSFKFYIDF